MKKRFIALLLVLAFLCSLICAKNNLSTSYILTPSEYFDRAKTVIASVSEAADPDLTSQAPTSVLPYLSDAKLNYYSDNSTGSYITYLQWCSSQSNTFDYFEIDDGNGGYILVDSLSSQTPISYANYVNSISLAGYVYYNNSLVSVSSMTDDEKVDYLTTFSAYDCFKFWWVSFKRGFEKDSNWWSNMKNAFTSLVDNFSNNFEVFSGILSGFFTELWLNLCTLYNKLISGFVDIFSPVVGFFKDIRIKTTQFISIFLDGKTRVLLLLIPLDFEMINSAGKPLPFGLKINEIRAVISRGENYINTHDGVHNVYDPQGFLPFTQSYEDWIEDRDGGGT